VHYAGNGSLAGERFFHNTALRYVAHHGDAVKELWGEPYQYSTSGSRRFNACAFLANACHPG